MIPPRTGAIIQTNFVDNEALRMSYMPFVIEGGLFVQSMQKVKLGQEILVIANIPKQSQKYPVVGKVMWILPRTNGIKPQGFAIQLSGEKGLAFRIEVERVLAGSLNLDLPTYTM